MKRYKKHQVLFRFADKRVLVEGKRLLKGISGVWLLQFFQMQPGLSLRAPVVAFTVTEASTGP